MPRIRVKSKVNKVSGSVLDLLADSLPGNAAPIMNIHGKALHDGGVGETEIMVEFEEFSARDRNVNDIQITIVAHRFPERVAGIEWATKAFQASIESVMKNVSQPLKLGVSIELVDMGYETIDHVPPEPELDEDGFIIWTGGERPVPPEAIVAVKVQGKIPRVPVAAKEWPPICWRHRPRDDEKSKWNIIAYKVVG